MNNYTASFLVTSAGVLVSADDIAGDSHTHANQSVLDATTASYTTAEESKLAAIEASATADQTGAEIVAAIDSELASTDWQTGGAGGDAAYGTGASDPTTSDIASGKGKVWRNTTSNIWSYWVNFSGTMTQIFVGNVTENPPPPP